MAFQNLQVFDATVSRTYMSIATTHPKVAERYSTSLGLLTSALFGATYALTITITILCAYYALSGAGRMGPASSTLFWLLVGNLGLIFGLGIYLAARLLRLLRPSRDETYAPRLHVRFAMLFSGAAVLPAIVVGIIFAIVYSQGIDSWFSPVVETAVDKARDVAKAAFEAEADEIVSEIQPMARDLNQPQAVAQLSRGRIVYTSYLRLQAERRYFQSAYVIDRAGGILAHIELSVAPPFLAPSENAFKAADAGQINLQYENAQNLIRGLFRLKDYPNAYLYVARFAKGGSLKNYQEAQDAREAYRLAKEQRGRLTRSFALVYAESALLVLVGAIWVGLAAANRVVFPIGRLALAAHQVRDGNLDIRVPPGKENDELSSLSTDFNEMVTRLQTQRKELVTAHDESELRRIFTEKVLAGVSAGVFGLDADYKIMFANKSALGLLQLPGDGWVLGRDLRIVAPFLSDQLEQFEGKAREQVSSVIKVDDTEDALTLHVAITADGSGKGRGCIVTFDDMSRVISDQRSAAWREVARRIAHEIKNPLTPIQLSAERLRKKYKDEISSSPEIFDRCIDTIQRQVGDIGRMIDEFSSFARMPEPQMARYDLCALVRETAFGRQVAFPDVEITFADGPKNIWVECDERLISQAILNILKNAEESTRAYAEKDDEKPAISIRARKSGLRAILEIEDNGPGWPHAQRERLLEPYMTTRAKGTGLGLAIVKRIVEDHKGNLELNDRADKKRGAVVTLEFPLLDPGEQFKEQTDVG